MSSSRRYPFFFFLNLSRRYPRCRRNKVLIHRSKIKIGATVFHCLLFKVQDPLYHSDRGTSVSL